MDTDESPIDTRFLDLVNEYLQLATSPQNASSPAHNQTIINQLTDLVRLQPQKNLLQIIRAARPGLTSDSDPSRASANKLLADVVARLAESQSLAKNQVNLLVEFFIEKLSDGPTIVIEALAALKSLSTSPNFQSDHAVSCCKGLFTHISAHEFSQPGRLAVLMLIDSLMAHNRNTLKEMGQEFLAGYCALAEGEKDPRNLVVAFKLAQVILTEFELGEKVEDMFDITFCYFPITFRPPPGNPDAYGGITTEELKQGLVDCLASTHRFGILAMPLLLDKFQAPGLGPKAQVLETVIRAFPIYGQAAVSEFASLFWESFFIEIFQSNTPPTKDFLRLLKHACQTLLRTIFPPDTKKLSPSGPVDFIKKALNVTLRELHSPEKSKAVPATRLIGWIIESGANLADVVLPAIHTSVTTLSELWKDTGDGEGAQTKRASILGHLSAIFSCVGAVARDRLAGVGDQTSGLLPTSTRDVLLNMLITVVLEGKQETCSPILAPAMRTLVKLVAIPGVLSLQEARNVIDTVTQVYVSMDDDDISDAAIESLSLLSETHPAEVASITLPELFSRLPGTNPSKLLDQLDSAAVLSPDKYIKMLEGLATLCDHSALFEPFVLRLLDRLDYSFDAASGGFDGHSMSPHTSLKSDPFDYHRYCHHLLLCLYVVIKAKVEPANDTAMLTADYFDGYSKVMNHACWIKARLFRIFICENGVLGRLSNTAEAQSQSDAGARDDVEFGVVREPGLICQDVRLAMDAGRIINLLVRHLDLKEQQDFVIKLHAAYHLGEIDALVAEARKVPSASVVSPLAHGQSIPEPMCIDQQEPCKALLVLFSEALIGIRPDVNVPDEILSTTESLPFKYYYNMVETGASASLVGIEAGLRLLSSTVNRRAADFPDFFSNQLDQFWDSQIKGGPLLQQQHRTLALEIWLWVTKALIVRSDARGYQLLERVCGLLEEESEFGRWAARRLCVTVDEQDETLSAKNHATVKFLWKQRVCHYLVKQLVQGYHHLIDGDRTVYLVGLSSLLARVAPALISSELSKIIPLLIEALTLPDIGVKLDSLKTIYELMVDGKMDMVFENHLLPLVAVLLLNCAFECLRKGTEMDCSSSIVKDNSSQVVTSQAVRLSALKMLAILPVKVGEGSSLPTDEGGKNQGRNVTRGLLYGEKQKVLKALTKALDDPRREVRRMAVDCRAEWYSLNFA